MGYSKFNKKDNSSMITMVGRLFCEENDICYERDTRILDELMKLQSSAMRVSYNDITKRDLNRKSSTEKTAKLFINNQRYMRDAYSLAEQNIDSQSSLLPTYLEETERRFKKTLNKIDKLSNSKIAKFKEERLFYLNKKLTKLDNQIKFYKSHIENETVPPAVFGGKQNMRLLDLGKITKEEWVNSRRNCLYSVGEKSKNGNENTKLTYISEGEFALTVLNPLENVKGNRVITMVFCTSV